MHAIVTSRYTFYILCQKLIKTLGIVGQCILLQTLVANLRNSETLGIPRYHFFWMLTLFLVLELDLRAVWCLHNPWINMDGIQQQICNLVLTIGFSDTYLKLKLFRIRLWVDRAKSLQCVGKLEGKRPQGREYFDPDTGFCGLWKSGWADSLL